MCPISSDLIELKFTVINYPIFEVSSILNWQISSLKHFLEIQLNTSLISIKL
jgi:hypothetical protein